MPWRLRSAARPSSPRRGELAVSLSQRMLKDLPNEPLTVCAACLRALATNRAELDGNVEVKARRVPEASQRRLGRSWQVCQLEPRNAPVDCELETR